MSAVLRLGAVAALTVGVTCARFRQEERPVMISRAPATLPDLPTAQLAPPAVAQATGASQGAIPDTAREPHVDIDTHGRDEDVRPLLEFVARTGGYRLIYPVGEAHKVRIDLNNVPVSVALTSLLDLANLKLESTTPGAQPALNRPVVFYELPVNVDSLSVDAIVRRFGVTRAVAEMIVDSRRPR